MKLRVAQQHMQREHSTHSQIQDVEPWRKRGQLKRQGDEGRGHTETATRDRSRDQGPTGPSDSYRDGPIVILLLIIITSIMFAIVTSTMVDDK